MRTKQLRCWSPGQFHLNFDLSHDWEIKPLVCRPISESFQIVSSNAPATTESSYEAPLSPLLSCDYGDGGTGPNLPCE